MSDAAQSQAIMFEPTDEPRPRAARAEPAQAGRPGRTAQAEHPGEGGQATHLEAVAQAEVDQMPRGRESSTEAREQITFEQGYEELKGIVSRLDDPELPVHEMFEGFRRGKGLEKALRAYLQEREGELAELEEGNNLPEFEIASPSGVPAAER
jgi:exodeoxyribonuclease VII small subunit